MENDPGFTILLALGLFLLMLGISFFRERILYIKKSHFAIATMFKQEEREGAEGETIYVPFFKFTSYSNQEVIFEHHSTERRHKWAIGDKMKVAYQESILDINNPLPLIFNDVFGLSAFLMTIGIMLLIVSGCIYWKASDQTHVILLAAITVPFVSAFYIWVKGFFKKLQ